MREPINVIAKFRVLQADPGKAEAKNTLGNLAGMVETVEKAKAAISDDGWGSITEEGVDFIANVKMVSSEIDAELKELKDEVKAIVERDVATPLQEKIDSLKA
eukprot:282050-Pyramimonas_sp.AAC.1